jgi:DNA-binding transcriptional ArsR family regulator
VFTYQASRALDALGDPTRRAIFELISRRPSAVVDIADDLPVSRPAVSQHLKVLKEAGLVVDRAEGTRRLYSIDRAGLAALRDSLEQLWDTALDAFRRAAEESFAAEAVAPEATKTTGAKAGSSREHEMPRADPKRRERGAAIKRRPRTKENKR